jgi:hypothetical protein
MKPKILLLQIFISFCILLFCTCTPDPITTPFTRGKICNGDQILAFADWTELQNEYNALYNSYSANDYDEDILLDWDDANNFSSLLKKDYDMDIGIRPDEADFDPNRFTIDDLFASFLNEKGMIIINDTLYLWDAQCVISGTNFSCANYDILYQYSIQVQLYNQNPSSSLLQDIADLANQGNIEQYTTCGIPKYDFEARAENPSFGDIPANPNYKAGCGLDVSINASVVSNDALTKTAVIHLKAEGSSIGGQMPILVWKLPNISTTGVVTITNTPTSAMNNTDWWDWAQTIPITISGSTYQITIQPRFYGKEWEITVNYTNDPILDIHLRGYFGLFSGNSCSAYDNQTVDFDCPILISKELLNRDNCEWKFTLEGYVVPLGEDVNWDFGDGNSLTTTGQQYVIYNYSGCAYDYYTVQANINNDTICNRSPIVDGIYSGDPCKFSTCTYREPGYKEDGKRVRLVIKMKLKWDMYLYSFTEHTKVKAKYKWRHGDFKNIETTGEIYLNTDCSPVNFSSLTPIYRPDDPAKWNKKKLKQIYKDGNHYVFDARTPYNVKFTNSNSAFSTKNIHLVADCVLEF